jgi:uncharacterized membrane protein (TIGR02234 family)
MAKPERRKPTVLTAQLLLMVAAGGLWAAARLPWVVVRSFDGLGPPRTATISGATWSAALVPLAVLLLAIAIAALAVRGWPLRMLALLTAAASLASGYLAIGLWALPDVAARGADLAHVPVATLVGSERRYWGAVITLVATACMVAGAVLLMRSATGAATTKYATTAARRSMARRDTDSMSERAMWDALDEGHDPTHRPGEPGTPPDQDSRHEPDTEGR